MGVVGCLNSPYCAYNAQYARIRRQCLSKNNKNTITYKNAQTTKSHVVRLISDYDYKFYEYVIN